MCVSLAPRLWLQAATHILPLPPSSPRVEAGSVQSGVIGVRMCACVYACVCSPRVEAGSGRGRRHRACRIPRRACRT